MQNSFLWTKQLNKNYTYSVQSTQLERLEHIKDLGTAYSYLGVIKRNFIYLDEDAFVIYLYLFL